MNKMLKHKIILIHLLLICSISNSQNPQNLIPNGDFEQYTRCPFGLSNVSDAQYWEPPTLGSSDYYNSCSYSRMMSVPKNMKGFQPAHSGVAYAGIFTWEKTINKYSEYREYIETPFIGPPLIANQCYHFEMYINLADTVKYNSYAIGVYFSDTPIRSSFGKYLEALPFTPQIQNSISNLPDTLNWTLVSGDYLAHGGERYLTIGNFIPDIAMNILNYKDSGQIYLYIDDVSLIPIPCTTVIDTVILGSDTTICSGQNLTVNATISNATYLWQDNSTNPTYTITQSGTYWVKVTSNLNTYTDTITVNFNTADTVNITICATCYQVGGKCQTQSGTYYDTLSTKAGCDSIIITKLTLYIPSDDTIVIDTSICQGDSIYIHGRYRHLSGTFKDIAFKPNACGSIIFITNLTVHPIPLAGAGTDVAINRNTSITLTASGSNTYLWDNGSTTQSITVAPAQTTTYCVTVTTSGNCSDTACATVIVTDSAITPILWVPNVFTPNSDGLNELFRVGSFNITEFKALIFNRWGEQLYKWNDENGGWDGTFKGKQCPDGVYVYIVSAKGIDNVKYNKVGHLTLIR